MKLLCNPRTETDTSPPKKEAPGLVTEARINRRKLDSSVGFYHDGTPTPRGLSRLSSAQPIETWHQLRSLARPKGAGS